MNATSSAVACGRAVTSQGASVVPAMIEPWNGSMNTTRPSCKIEQEQQQQQQKQQQFRMKISRYSSNEQLTSGILHSTQNQHINKSETLKSSSRVL
jgi:hypothetical protein